MKKKLLSIILMVALVLTAVVALVACNNAGIEDAKEYYETNFIKGKTFDKVNYTLQSFVKTDNGEYYITWESNNDNVSVALDDTNKKATVKATQTTEVQEYTLTGTISDGKNTATVEVKGTVPAAVISEEWGTLQSITYSGGTTTLDADVNNAATFGLDATKFAVVTDQFNGTSSDGSEYTQKVGLNKDGTIRLYFSSNSGNTMTIAVKEGTYITRVTVTLTHGEGTYDKSEGTKLQINGGDLIDAHQDATLDPVVVNSGSVVLKNATTGDKAKQIWIKKIDNEYKQGTAPNGGYITFPGEPQPVVVTTDHKGTKEDPYSAKDAKAVASALASGKYTENPVYMTAIVTGVKVSTISSSGATVYDVDVADAAGAAKVMAVYHGNLAENGAVPAVGDKITVSGYLTNYSGNTPQFASNQNVYPVITVIEVGNATIKAATTNQHATVTFTDPAPVEGVVSGKNGATVKFTVAADSGYEITAVKIGGNEVEAVEGVYTVTLNGNLEVVVEIKAAGSTEQTATLKHTHTGSATNIGKDGVDEALLGLDGEIFTVTSSSNYSDNKGNKAGINKDGTIRLYVGEKIDDTTCSSNGCSLTITVAEGYVIKSITVNAKAAKDTVLMKIGDGEAITLTATATDTKADVNATSITIQNVNTTNVQIYINSITIVYDVVAAD